MRSALPAFLALAIRAVPIPVFMTLGHAAAYAVNTTATGQSTVLFSSFIRVMPSAWQGSSWYHLPESGCRGLGLNPSLPHSGERSTN